MTIDNEQLKAALEAANKEVAHILSGIGDRNDYPMQGDAHETIGTQQQTEFNGRPSEIIHYLNERLAPLTDAADILQTLREVGAAKMRCTSVSVNLARDSFLRTFVNTLRNESPEFDEAWHAAQSERTRVFSR